MSTHHSPWTTDSKPEQARHLPRGRKLTTSSGTVIAHGMPARAWFDLYHRALNLNWPTFFGALAAMFLILNTVFASIYMLGTDPIAHQSPPGFPGAFFFSVETLATVGYGDMHPQTYYAHIVATLEIFTGMSGIALATGLVFARFSRPRAKIIFARHVVVRTYDGRPTLMVRSANARQNVIAEANAKLRLVRRETTPEGDVLWRIRDLRLVRDQHPIFLLGWLLVHVIDETSPLYGETAESLAQSEASFMVMIEGSDETTAQTMQARHEWSHGDIRWQHRFADLLHDDEEGITHIDYSQFDKVVPVDTAGKEPTLEAVQSGARPC
jgi:inward rectifier potassium channel